MIDVNKVKSDAEKEFQEENMKVAKEKIKSLLRKRHQAHQVLSNIDREISDAYAELGQGTTASDAG